MSSLIILGNKNKYTFYNAIVSAAEKSKDIFSGEPLAQIYVIHSPESFDALFSAQNQSNDLLENLEKHGIRSDHFIHRTIDTVTEDYSVFLEYIRSIIVSIKHNKQSKNLMIDITNGTINMKSILSIISYILDINNVFFIDSSAMFRDHPDIPRTFPEPQVVSPYYIQSVPNKTIDELAYLNLTEVTRYKERIDSLSETYHTFGKPFDNKIFFQNNLLSAIQLKLSNDESSGDESVYRISSTAISSSIEDMIDRFLQCRLKQDSAGKTLGQKIYMLQDILESISADAGSLDSDFDFDFEFLKRFNEFILYLRNSTVHHFSAISASERFKASLSMQMSLIFLDYYSKIVFEYLKDYDPRPKQRPAVSVPAAPKYYGLDGDNTGRRIEALLADDASESEVREVSYAIASAKNDVRKYIKEHHGTIIFAEGDDILFKGSFSLQQLEHMKQIYTQRSQGITCSIAYGNSFREVFLAMKLAKTQHDTISGLSISPSQP